MQQVARTNVQIEARGEAAEQVEVKKFDPWTIGLPAIIITAWLIIASWAALVLFVVQAYHWQSEVWF